MTENDNKFPDPDLNTNEADQRPTRSKWPKDRKKKIASMTKAMPEFIGPYFGGETAIAHAMSVTPFDVREVIQADPKLVEMQEIAVNSVEALLLDRMTHLALTTKSSAPTKWLLERKFPEKYGSSKAKETKSKGFTAPTEDAEGLPSVLDDPKKGTDDPIGSKEI